MNPQPQWVLPGMEKFSERELSAIKRSLDDEDIVYSISCLGWALWPTTNRGYYDTEWLRVIADFLEIQNKPFWDEYEAYCATQLPSQAEIEELKWVEELGSMQTPTSITEESVNS